MLLGLAAIGALCFTATLTFSPAEPAATRIAPRVRGATPQLTAVIEQGIRRSKTFARLVEQIERTDVVVYIETTRALPPGLDGRLMFLTAAGPVRYLHAQVAANRSFSDLIAIAGHELQHALEVAAHPEVRDVDALAMLYARIGIRGATSNRYDTTEAQIIGRRVRAELG